MFIEPIQLVGRIGSVADNRNAAKATGNTSNGFADVFKNVWNEAVETQNDLTEKQYLQSIGEIEDTHTLPIAASKAEMSLSLLLNLRNKALDSYNEIMRISV